MRVLIYKDLKEVNDNFEALRLRKSLKRSLEINNETYINHFLYKEYDLVQFTELDEVAFKAVKKEVNDNVKFIVGLLYGEYDYKSSVLEFKKEENGVLQPFINKNAFKLIEQFDYILAPTFNAKRFLINQGVSKPIFVHNPSININDFNLGYSKIRDICFRFLQLHDNEQIILTIINSSDIEAFKKLYVFADIFKNFKYVVISKTNKKKFPKEIKKMIKKGKSNVIIKDVLPQDVYYSLIFNCFAYINLSSEYPQFFQFMEIMAAKKEIFSLENKVYNDFLIDKQNGHVYNNLNGLIEDFKLFILGELEETKEKAYKFVKEHNLKKEGINLIKIYNSLIKESNIW